MAIKVGTFSGERVFPHAHDWYSGEDKSLQIYQEVDGDREFVIAEFAEGSWEYAIHDPLPVPPQPEEDEPTTDIGTISDGTTAVPLSEILQKGFKKQ